MECKGVPVEAEQGERSILIQEVSKLDFQVKRYLTLWMSSVIEEPSKVKFSLVDFQKMLDDFEVLFVNNIQPALEYITNDEDGFTVVSDILEKKIIFLGDSLLSGYVKGDAIQKVCGFELPDFNIENQSAIFVLFNVMLGIMMKYLTIINKYEDGACIFICEEDPPKQPNKENHTETELDTELQASAARINTSELRILKSAISKRSSDLRSYVLSKNLLTVATTSLREEWSSKDKVVTVRCRIREILELLDFIGNEINITLGLYIANNELYAAYSMLLRLLSLTKYRFMNHHEDILSFLTYHETECVRFCDQLTGSIRHLEGILDRRCLRFVEIDKKSGSSKISVIRIDDSEDMGFIISSLLSLLRCIRLVAKNEIPPIALSNVIRDSYLEVVNTKLRPDWSSVEKAFSKELPFSFETMVAEINFRM